ncbi:MAG: type 1 glutamine amidotransferase [Patescibacteria group bacterium]|nr:type 1 glutamine amidotransferase [Patescibacteria group bacterium]
MKKNILFVQIREDEATRKHELDSVVRASGIDASEFILHDLIKEPVELDALEGVAALMIGGCGEYEAHKDFPNRESLKELTKVAVRSGMPVLGLCFGAQFMADALGGKCIADKENEEIGTCVVQVTDEASDDPLFRDYPKSFKATEGHHDRIEYLPDGCTVLATTAKCPMQAFRIGKGPVYGVQFHPELNKEGLLWRLDYYSDLYVDSKEQFQAVADSAEETPVACRLLKDWAKRIVHKEDLI